MKVLLFPFFAGCCLLSVSLHGNEGNQSVATDNNLSKNSPNISAPNPPVRTSMNRTLEDASRKLRSSHIQDRVGAAKLLGKYPGGDSALLLIGSLDDSSELVRRAAMVSLVEHFNNGAPIYEQPLAEKIFSMIGDSDVEVRREVTALIPRLIPGLMHSGMERVQLNGRTVFRSVPGRLREDLLSEVEARLLDTDSIVRQNLLKHHFSLRFQMKPETFAQLLNDADSSVQLVALDQVRMYASQPGVYSALENLVSSKDIGVRAKLAKTVQSLGRSFPNYRNILRKLTDDSVDEIATLAAVDLARLGEPVSEKMLQRISSFLFTSRGLHGKTETLFYSLSALGTKAGPIYESLLEHPSPSMRSKAWERYLAVSEGWGTPAIWIPALSDRDSQVRDAVLPLVRGRVEAISAEELLSLIQNKYPEVRVLSAELLLIAEQEVVQANFFDLLIDEDSLVRATTLRTLANIRLDGWIHLHKKSLLDSDYAIQRAAMDGLLGDRKEGVPILLEFARKYPSEKISSLVRRELQQMGIQP